MDIQLTIQLVTYGAGIITGIIGYKFYLRRLSQLQKKIHRIQRGGK